MKAYLLFLLIGFTEIVFAQTENHKPVPGTKYSLIPPGGFVASKGFSGFENTSIGASIMLTELPAAVNIITDGFSREALETRGITLTDKQTIDFQNSKATYIQGTQQGNGKTYLKQILIFGDSSKTVLVNANYPEAHKAIETDIRRSVLSTIYNKSQNDNPLDAVPFKIDVTGTEFKLSKYLAGSLIYTTDGQIPSEKPTLIVASSITKVSIINEKQFAVDRFKKLPGADSVKITEINPVEIDNLKGYEIIAEGTTGEKHQLMYQVMLYTETGGYFMILGMVGKGIATEEIEKNLRQFKYIANTFKRK